MNTTKILELLSYTIPAIVTGAVAVYFFKVHMKGEDNRRSFLLRKEKQSIALPLRLQAYERMALFLERISVANLLIRIAPSGTDKSLYLKKLTSVIETEFEHNLAQQIYVTDECWNVIKTAKNSTLNMFRNVTAEPEIKDAKAMRESILQKMVDANSPTATALAYIKSEVGRIF